MDEMNSCIPPPPSAAEQQTRARLALAEARLKMAQTIFLSLQEKFPTRNAHDRACTAFAEVDAFQSVAALDLQKLMQHLEKEPSC